jgi:LacI family transcriptional regulator
LAAYRALVEGRRVDGTVVIRTRLRDERIAYLVERGFPFVAFGRTDDGLAFPYIDEDGESGTFQLVNHLAQLGHERIAYIAAPQELTFGVNRLRGYQRAMHEIGLSPNGDYVAVADLTRTGGMAAATRLLDLKVPPTAIVAANDLMALGAVTLAKDRKMVIGRDLSVAGFDDIPTAEALGLTTLSQPIYSIGRKLSRMLIALIRGEPLDEPKVLLQPRLVSRPSIGPPA